MKRKLLIMGTIVASIGLTACNSDDNKNVEPSNESPIETPTPSQPPNQVDENINDDLEDIKEDGKDLGEDVEEKIDQSVMTDEEMIEASDYIAKVKKIQKGQNTFELKVLENIKGNLTGKDIPNADLFEKNRAYVIFLRDNNGVLEPTNGNDSYILLQGDQHEIFEKINNHNNR